MDENDTFILKDPFRPTDKTVTEVLSHFPSISNMEIINTAGQIHHLVYEPYTTTSNENLVQSTQESMSIVKATPRPPFHVMTPPNLSTSTSSTPHPPAASPIHAPQAGSCGTPVLKKQCPKGRIVNGTQSCYGQFPWQVIKDQIKHNLIELKKNLKSGFCQKNIFLWILINPSMWWCPDK